jgi:hypothetical protein
MTPQLPFEPTDFEFRAISPLYEMGAYEALWDKPETTFKTLSEKFKAQPDAVPSDFVPKSKALEYAALVQESFRKADVTTACAFMGLAIILTSCATPRIQWNSSITRAGGTWSPRIRWR